MPEKYDCWLSELLLPRLFFFCRPVHNKKFFRSFSNRLASSFFHSFQFCIGCCLFFPSTPLQTFQALSRVIPLSCPAFATWCNSPFPPLPLRVQLTPDLSSTQTIYVFWSLKQIISFSNPIMIKILDLVGLLSFCSWHSVKSTSKVIKAKISTDSKACMQL